MTQRNAGKAPRFYEVKKSAAHFLSGLTELLTEYGAESFMVQNPGPDRRGAVAFQLGGLAYRISPDVEAMAARLARSSRKGKAPADAVAWAQARHLLELQLEAIETGAAKASEVLGGYVLTTAGETVGEMIERRADELLPGDRLLMPGVEL